MRIKSDFVTNSSSAGYILALDSSEIEIFLDYVNALNDHEEARNEGVGCSHIANNIKELNEYTNNGPWDWASIPRGVRFENLDKDQYKICERIINNGGSVFECWVDYNVFYLFWEEYCDKVVREIL